MTVPRTATGVRALLGANGLSPRRLRGQNFLVDGNFVDAIVRAAAPGPDDCILEIGTGTGILTDALADRAGAVVTCDIDERLQEMARGLRAWPPGTTFVRADALDGKHALNPAVVEAWRAAAAGRTLRVVSNLP
jgi:16S rRNA (adenine1518-N6/adenine1519-N6)-dimethyltransferase